MPHGGGESHGWREKRELGREGETSFEESSLAVGMEERSSDAKTLISRVRKYLLQGIGGTGKERGKQSQLDDPRGCSMEGTGVNSEGRPQMSQDDVPDPLFRSPVSP